MMNDEGTKVFEETVRKILDIEVEMFLTVATRTDPDCRSRINDMRLHRSSQFAGWSTQTVMSYLSDLEQAVERSDNLMTLKYARMDGRIPPLSKDPRISEIVEASVAWQKAFISKFPNIMKGGRDIDDFRNYLRSELETYSSVTLKSLKTDIDAFIESGRSMAEAVYDRMARLAGYESLNDMESKLAD